MEDKFMLKTVFNMEAVVAQASRTKTAYPDFDQEGFIGAVDAHLEPLQFLDRAQLIARELWSRLPQPYDRAIGIILESLPEENTSQELEGYEGFIIMPLSMLVAEHGLGEGDFDLSMEALVAMTKRFTSEGAIRPFLDHHEEKTLAYMHRWARDENVHVRRLVSEGSRPRLPLSSPLRKFKADPGPVLDLLDLLKNEPTRLVQRSIANNLNDISKDNPDHVVTFLEDWKAQGVMDYEWIANHALRTLKKQGHEGAMKLLGFDPQVRVVVHDLHVEPQVVERGQEVHFVFILENQGDQDLKAMVDYQIHYMKANGKQRPKVFKIAVKALPAGGVVKVTGKRSFKDFSTRKHYPGRHGIDVLVNGKVKASVSFEVK